MLSWGFSELVSLVKQTSGGNDGAAASLAKSLDKLEGLANKKEAGGSKYLLFLLDFCGICSINRSITSFIRVQFCPVSKMRCYYRLVLINENVTKSPKPPVIFK